jgi:hypothetical protein
MLYMKIFLKVTPTISKFYGNCFQKKQKLAAIKEWLYENCCEI